MQSNNKQPSSKQYFPVITNNLFNLIIMSIIKNINTFRSRVISEWNGIRLRNVSNVCRAQDAGALTLYLSLFSFAIGNENEWSYVNCVFLFLFRCILLSVCHSFLWDINKRIRANLSPCSKKGISSPSMSLAFLFIVQTCIKQDVFELFKFSFYLVLIQPHIRCK